MDGETAPQITPVIRPRFEGIDVVRGLACLWVVMHHGWTFWVWRLHIYGLSHLTDFARLGYLGVHLFLVISGFVLFYPVIRKNPPRQVRVEAGKFYFRRSRRILPPYYVALLLCGLLLLTAVGRKALETDVTVVGIVMHLTMTYNLWSGAITRYNGSFWSLALEFQLYLSFPLLIWVCRRAGLWVMLAMTLAVSVIWQAVIVPHVLPPVQLFEGHYIWGDLASRYYALPGRWFEFAAGMTAAAMVVRPVRYQAWIATGLMLLAMPIAIKLVFPINPLGGQFGVARDQLWGITFASLLVLIASVPPRVWHNPLVRAIDWIGGISFSIYLIHQPFLQITRHLVDHFNIPLTHRLPWLLLVAMPILIGMSFCFFWLFERPFTSPSQRSVVEGKPVVPDAATVV
jgi:peptidoglycan/LPS O-acetylase OafA/YrhL